MSVKERHTNMQSHSKVQSLLQFKVNYPDLQCSEQMICVQETPWVWVYNQAEVINIRLMTLKTNRRDHQARAVIQFSNATNLSTCPSRRKVTEPLSVMETGLSFHDLMIIVKSINDLAFPLPRYSKPETFTGVRMHRPWQMWRLKSFSLDLFLPWLVFIQLWCWIKS